VKGVGRAVLGRAAKKAKKTLRAFSRAVKSLAKVAKTGGKVARRSELVRKSQHIRAKE